MASWVLIPCLKQLFAEFDRIASSRDKASDGSIGDTTHEQEVSDHNPDEVGSVPIHDADKVNEVHAIDVDNDLRESDLTMEKVVQFLLGRCRSGAEKRLRYIIWNKRIWSASSGWVQKTYTGASQHTEHAHFSASYTTSLEASTASWHLEDIPVALTPADKAALIDGVADEIMTRLRQTGDVLSITERKRIADEIWHYPLTRPNGPAVAGGAATTDSGDYQRYNDVVNTSAADKVLDQLSPKLDKLTADVEALLTVASPAK